MNILMRTAKSAIKAIVCFVPKTTTDEKEMFDGVLKSKRADIFIKCLMFQADSENPYPDIAVNMDQTFAYRFYVQINLAPEGERPLSFLTSPDDTDPLKMISLRPLAIEREEFNRKNREVKDLAESFAKMISDLNHNIVVEVITNDMTP